MTDHRPPGPAAPTRNWYPDLYRPQPAPPVGMAPPPFPTPPPRPRTAIVLGVLVAVGLAIVLGVLTTINEFAGRGGVEVAAGEPAGTSTGLEVVAAPLTRVEERYDGILTCTTVSYRNGGSRSTSYSLLDWTLTGPRGDRATSAFTTRPGQLGYGELAPGATASGEVCFRGYAPGRHVLTAEDFTTLRNPEPLSWVDDLR